MNSQTWMEQTRILAKERPISFTCILFMAVVGAVPLSLFLTFIMASCGISIFSFIFLEGSHRFENYSDFVPKNAEEGVGKISDMIYRPMA